MKKIALLLLWLLFPTTLIAAPLFGPVDYQAGLFGIKWDSVNFSVTTPGEATIQVEKLSSDKRYYRGSLTFNGVSHSLTEFLKSAESKIAFATTVGESNQLKGYMIASPGAVLRVTINGTELPPDATFLVEPATIKKGEEATLSWQTERTNSISIEPDVGAVATSGSIQVSPTTSTLYTLKASGSGGSISREVEVRVQGCVSSIAYNEADLEAFGGTDRVAVILEDGCEWTASSDVSWIEIDDIKRVGKPSFHYIVRKNRSSQPREGRISVGGQQLQLFQAGLQDGPRLYLDSHVDGSSVNFPVVQIKGHFVSKSTHSWIQVNGKPTDVYEESGDFVYNNLRLKPGENRITITGVNANGQKDELQFTLYGDFEADAEWWRMNGWKEGEAPTGLASLRIWTLSSKLRHRFVDSTLECSGPGPIAEIIPEGRFHNEFFFHVPEEAHGIYDCLFTGIDAEGTEYPMEVSVVYEEYIPYDDSVQREVNLIEDRIQIAFGGYCAQYSEEEARTKAMEFARNEPMVVEVFGDPQEKYVTVYFILGGTAFELECKDAGFPPPKLNREAEVPAEEKPWGEATEAVSPAGYRQGSAAGPTRALRLSSQQPDPDVLPLRLSSRPLTPLTPYVHQMERLGGLPFFSKMSPDSLSIADNSSIVKL